ncbi:unnamed protein product [Brassica rapa subsp. narinosa]
MHVAAFSDSRQRSREKKECERERKSFPTRFAGPNQRPHWSLPWRFFREQQRKKKKTTKRKKKEEVLSELLESLWGRRQNHSLGKQATLSM